MVVTPHSGQCSSETERPSSIISTNGGFEPISTQDPFLQIASSPFHLQTPARPLQLQNSQSPRFKSSLIHLYLQAKDPSRCQQQGQERIQEDCAVGRGTAAGGGRWWRNWKWEGSGKVRECRWCDGVGEEVPQKGSDDSV